MFRRSGFPLFSEKNLWKNLDRSGNSRLSGKKAESWKRITGKSHGFNLVGDIPVNFVNVISLAPWEGLAVISTIGV